MAFAEELRLIWFLLLNAAAFSSAWRVASRFGTQSISLALLDALLLNCIIQYAVVCGLGAIGILSPITITTAAVLICAASFALTAKHLSSIRPTQLTEEGRLAMAVMVFAGGYLLSYCIMHRLVPVLETDALAYHLPTAIGWLQTGRLTLFESWYWNPANTYSPIAAEAFMVWLLAPMRSDIFVRFVQTPALVIVGLAMYRIGRQLGARPIVAACIAVAAMLSRSIFAEATLVKDDLWVTAFFIASIAALTEAQIDLLTPWRIGCAMGLLLSTKYPALLTLPLVALVIATPLRTWGARRWVILISTVVLLAGPWYLRNAIAFGNPLFPMILKVGGHVFFDGQFNVVRDASTRTPAAIWKMVSDPYFGTPRALLLALTVLWGTSAARAVWMRGRLRASIGAVRFALWGPVLGPAVFSLLSPHPEIRYFFPFLLPLFAASCLALAEMNTKPALQISIAAALSVWATATSFQIGLIEYVFQFALGGAVVAIICWLVVAFWRQQRNLILLLAGLGTFVLSLFAYVEWNGYTRAELDAPSQVWPSRYGNIGEVWLFVRNELPADATIAYANTYLIYPLFGPRYERRVVYAPVRAAERSFNDLPHMGDRVPQDKIVETVTAAMNENADESAWLNNLTRLKASYVFIAKNERSLNPPEMQFIRNHPHEFTLISPENSEAAVYSFSPGSR